MKSKLPVLIGIIAALASAGTTPAFAIPYTSSASYATALEIPDNDIGVADTRQFVMPGATTINSVRVMLNISGGYNGDYYVYLRHGVSGFAVLLNRAGVTADNPLGYFDSGFNVTFSDTAANGDIHSYQNLSTPGLAALTGIWQPDGRNIDPNSVSDTDPRTAMLGSFNGMDPNGDWTLYVADNSSIGIGTLLGWGLTINADAPAIAIPDASATLPLLAAASGLVILCVRLRHFRNRQDG